MRENLKIRDKATARLVPLNPNLAQLKVWNTMELQRSRELPVRVLIAKARQEGVSTLIEGTNFAMINHHPNTVAQVVSADDDSTDQVFSMTKLMQQEMPGYNRRPTVRSSRKEIAYSAPHRSKFVVQTAGKDVLGRGGTVHYFHGSEVAFWPNAKQGLGGALQQVPDVAGTEVALESTGNGVGGEFYDRYVAAVERLKFNPNDYAGFLPIFLPWHIFDGYRKKIAPEVNFAPTPEEKGLRAKYSLDYEQLYWRRTTITDKCGGDLGLFKQEYPADWRECFQASGRSVFSHAMLNRWEDKALEGWYGIFESGELRPALRSMNCWTIWTKPEPGHQYAMGIDSMEGKVSDSKNARSDPDYHGVVIYDRNDNEVVAIYHGRGDQQPLGEQCLQAAKYYNNAYVAVEIPCGLVVLNVFKRDNYPNLFRRQIHDERQNSDETEDLGWRTTPQTRPVMVQTLLGFLRDSEPHIHSMSIIHEMRTFVWDKNGKPVHLPGEHDDLLFAQMIALEVHKRCPMAAMPYAYATTGDFEIKRSGLGIEYAGGYDTGLFGSDDGSGDSDFDFD
jgi:hypothetical protein